MEGVAEDLRTGEILSNPRQRAIPGSKPTTPQNEPPPVPFDPSVPVPPDLEELEQPKPVWLIATGRYLMELGETSTSAVQRVQNQIAVQIVSVMERKW